MISKIYGEKINGEWEFKDLRVSESMKQNYFRISGDGELASDMEKNNSSLYRLAEYKKIKDCELDCCKTAKYKCAEIELLYKVLWFGIDFSVVDSGETLVASTSAIIRYDESVKKKQRGIPSIDWDIFLKKYENKDIMSSYAKSVAFIGNFMPVPSAHQFFLRNKYERFDLVLTEIKNYYLKDVKISIKNEKKEKQIEKWLDLFIKKENGVESWKNFVDMNFLRGSFVDEEYNVVDYKVGEEHLEQLSTMLYKRSVKMIVEFEKRIKSWNEY